jgi:nucleotidyltransferase/DNA polymerase involved in DNA repair
MNELARLRNVGKACLADFHLLGIRTVEQLAAQDADHLYGRLCELTKQRQDPCVHDVLAATIHQAKTGEALNWWAFTAARKARGDWLAAVHRSP